MEIKRAEFFQFTRREVFLHISVTQQLLEEISVIRARMFRLPRLHGIALHQFVSLFAG